MSNLSTRYLGLDLRSPLVASSSPLTRNLTNLKKLEDAGAAAVVLPSLFEEQILAEEEELDRFLSRNADSFAEAQSYFPDLGSYGMGPKVYLDHVEKARKALRIPVIGSLNGVSSGGWVRYARQIQDAGADALELNVYFLPMNPAVDSRTIESSYLDLVRDVKAQVSIPVAVKLAPYFTAMANMAQRLDRAGADGLVLFNRFYQPDFDLETLEVAPHLVLSTPDELGLRVHWTALLSTCVRSQLAVTGGVHSSDDVAKSILAGAQVVMLAASILKNGVGHIQTLERGLTEWMAVHEYESVNQMRGAMNIASVALPTAFERANYLKTLSSYTLG